jgi:hypothetical protein
MTAFLSPKVAGSARLAGVSASEKVLKGLKSYKSPGRTYPQVDK